MSTEKTSSDGERGLDNVLADLETLHDKAGKLQAKVEEGALEGKALDEVKDELSTIGESVKDLTAEREERLRTEEIAQMGANIKSLNEVIEELRKPAGGFGFSGGQESSTDSPYASGEEYSFFADVRAAGRGHQKALDRLVKSASSAGYDTKAMTEGTDSAGGYLVDPLHVGELVELREHATPFESLFPVLNVATDSVEITQQTGGLAAGWADELATKTSADFTFGQITASIFTAAGLGVVSNQLLADARPSIDGLIIRDLARRLGVVRETAVINGSGTGQPLGVLGTAGVTSRTYTDASPTASELLDEILELIAEVQEAAYTDVNAIAMHPSLWVKIIKAKESDGHYTVGQGANSDGRLASDALPSRTLFGYPVTLTYHMPTNLGTGTDETRVIVGDFAEGLVLRREGIQVADSSHVYFTTNQTIFRAEERLGFTAARRPEAFGVLDGTGLIVANY